MRLLNDVKTRKLIAQILSWSRLCGRQSTKYLPSSNSEKGFVSSAVVSATISVEEQDSPPKGRRAKGATSLRV
jgi:hypothetical protein